MFDNLWTERIDLMAGKATTGVAHKAGPREIGTIHGWKGYKYDDTDDGQLLGSERIKISKKDYKAEAASLAKAVHDKLVKSMDGEGINMTMQMMVVF